MAPAFAGDPVYGTWTVDVARSQYAAAADICYVTTLEDLGNGKFRLTSTRKRANGEVARQDTVSAFDGGDHPDGSGGTTAFTRIDEHRYVMVLKDHGTPLATVMRTISDDGRTMTDVANGSKDGKPFHETLVFERKDSSCEATPQNK